MAWPKRKILYWYLYLIVMLVILAAFFLLYTNKTAGVVKSEYKPEYKNIEINNTYITAETVYTPERQYLGLSNRESLCSNCGMLFVFPDEEVREFVMRDMKFPLDIVFMLNNKIINIAENLPPEGANPANVYTSATIANSVLELPAGFCQKNNIVPGDIIKLK